jgi:anti-sigma factor RsiW
VSHPRDDLTAYLDGALPPARIEEIARHLAGCAACTGELARTRAALAALGALPPPPEPSPFFGARLEAKLAGARERQRRPLSALLGRRMGLLAPAAAAALAAAIGVVWVRHGRTAGDPLDDEIALLRDYEVVASVGDVNDAEDAQIVAHLDELSGKEGRP